VNQRARLQSVHPFQVLDAQRLALGGQVHGLASGHAAQSCSLCQAAHQRKPQTGIRADRLIGQCRKRQCLEGIPGENGQGLTVGLVAGGLAAAHVVIVHGRQVVMDQRVDMDHLQRGRDPIQRGRRGRDGLTGRVDEQRAQALAAAERGIAHRRHHFRDRRLQRIQEPIEECLDPVLIRFDSGLHALRGGSERDIIGVGNIRNFCGVIGVR
jgi:hypothetical protein